ncbi:hypothetical protein WCX49_04360 [Sulfurimonas sp. HSL-1656]|uniref:hypothetical protein n=1 Tax=Thiomicrolovo subterrani TaxID=3131934 RepID=UPI0031F7E4C1
MKKIDALQVVAQAKKLQNGEMQKVLLMVKKIPLDGDEIATSYLECGVDKALRDDEEGLKKLVGASLIEEIEELHKQWHEEYYKIYELYQKEKGLVSKLFGSQPKLSELDQEKVMNYSNDLKELTRKIIYKLEAAEGRLKLLRG